MVIVRGSSETRGDTLQYWQHFSVKQVVVQREMEAFDPQFVKLQHPVEYGLRTADQTAGIAFVGVQQS